MAVLDTCAVEVRGARGVGALRRRGGAGVEAGAPAAPAEAGAENEEKVA